jgi:hypothetical protein
VPLAASAAPHTGLVHPSVAHFLSSLTPRSHVKPWPIHQPFTSLSLSPLARPTCLGFHRQSAPPLPCSTPTARALTSLPTRAMTMSTARPCALLRMRAGTAHLLKLPPPLDAQSRLICRLPPPAHVIGRLTGAQHTSPRQVAPRQCFPQTSAPCTPHRPAQPLHFASAATRTLAYCWPRRAAMAERTTCTGTNGLSLTTPTRASI